MALTIEEAKRIIEATLFYSREPVAIKALQAMFTEDDGIGVDAINEILTAITEDFTERGIELVQVSSGYRFQVCADLSPWITQMMAEKPARYSKALLETLALIAYKQPITRAEIEEVRGVGVSTNIIRTLEERLWIKVIGHRDVPGKPALFATTKSFLDDMNLTSLSELPTLAEIQNLDDGQLTKQLELALHEDAELAANINAEEVEEVEEVEEAEEVQEVQEPEQQQLEETDEIDDPLDMILEEILND